MDAKKVPTLEEWIMESFPGANLDNLQISARVVVQIAQSYADVQTASLRSRNSELVEGITAKVTEWRDRSRTSDAKTDYNLGYWKGMRICARELESLLTPDPAGPLASGGVAARVKGRIESE